MFAEMSKSFLRETLIPGEQVYFTTRVHWGTQILPAIIGVGADIAAFLFLSKIGMLKASPLPLLLLILPLIPLMLACIERSTTEIAITNMRVVRKTGWISRSTTEYGIGRVEAVLIHQGPIARLVGFGDVTVSGVGSGICVFRDIERPMEFREIMLSVALNRQQS